RYTVRSVDVGWLSAGGGSILRWRRVASAPGARPGQGLGDAVLVVSGGGGGQDGLVGQRARRGTGGFVVPRLQPGAAGPVAPGGGGGVAGGAVTGGGSHGRGVHRGGMQAWPTAST